MQFWTLLTVMPKVGPSQRPRDRWRRHEIQLFISQRDAKLARNRFLKEWWWSAWGPSTLESTKAPPVSQILKAFLREEGNLCEIERHLVYYPGSTRPTDMYEPTTQEAAMK